jgi:REP element-mobilizing transposase RayT
MSHVKIWIHAVWCTKNRERILTRDFREKLFNHIKVNATEKQIYIDFINGDLDHIHCLLALNADMSISRAMQLIKGESSYWVNKNSLLKPKLEWADEYFAVSVSESMIGQVRNYIKNQQAHYQKTSFQEEYERFIAKFNFSR